MYLFIFNSIGKHELIFVAIISLFVFGLPKLIATIKEAELMHKIIGVPNNFSDTWEQKTVSIELNEVD